MLLFSAGLFKCPSLDFCISAFHLLDLLYLVRICRPNELALHVVNVPLRIHEVLLLLPFNLNWTKHLVVSHVDALLLVTLGPTPWDVLSLYVLLCQI